MMTFREIYKQNRQLSKKGKKTRPTNKKGRVLKK